jgi:hypothetical protein
MEKNEIHEGDRVLAFNKWKVKTHKYIKRQNQSTTGKL